MPRAKLSPIVPNAAPSTSRAWSNIVVVRGTVADEPHQRAVPSGSVFETTVVTRSIVDGVTVREPVPVVWSDARITCSAGAEVIVRGRVRQRFFRAGPATVSRTEVIAEQIVLASRRPATAKLVDLAAHVAAPDVARDAVVVTDEIDHARGDLELAADRNIGEQGPRR